MNGTPIRARDKKMNACLNSECQFWIEGICNNARVGNGEVVVPCPVWKQHTENKKERGNEAH